ncbi:MAG: CBS domain-containing protein [Clostridiales Family XIII bacterium]|jgi:predicted transcriptional regulator|nr:CBS domain-containing protein [Clostridiales Family XIII bacterium]
MATISEIVEYEPYLCNCKATVRDVIKQLADTNVRGVPIVDDAGKLVGYISDTDILKYIAKHRPRYFDWGDMMPIVVDEDPMTEKIQSLLEVPVLEIARKRKVSVEADWEIDELASLFHEEKMKKIAVVDDDGKVIGVVSRSALIRYLLTEIALE